MNYQAQATIETMPSVDTRTTARGRVTAHATLLSRLKDLSISGLPKMYSPADGLYVFRVRPNGDGLAQEGLSRRYSAITLLGLANHPDAADATLGSAGVQTLCSRLLRDVDSVENLGDVALTLWAARALNHPGIDAALNRLRVLDPVGRSHPTVEVAWSLAALCANDDPMDGGLRAALADRLLQAFNPKSSIFPHVLGDQGSRRGHVACFADLVYPVHALARFGALTGSDAALAASLQCARHFCAVQGNTGQWWWHYDVRTGDVIEGYPVYAVHQDSMAPMALLEVQDATGQSFAREIALGLDWLVSSPELGGASLIDDGAGIIWRKVARREPAKLSRYIQAAATGVHPSLRVPGVEWILRPGTIDYEDRPYHLGWVLYAWTKARVDRYLSEVGK